MNLKLSSITLLVRDLDKAVEFYTEVLPFRLKTTGYKNAQLHYVQIGTGKFRDSEIQLKLAETEAEKKVIGKQSADSPFLTLESTDCEKDFKEFQLNSHLVLSEFIHNSFSMKDVSGNQIKIIQAKPYDTYSI